LDPGEELRDRSGGLGQRDAVKLADPVKRPGQEGAATLAVRFEIALVLYGVEVVFAVVNVQVIAP
jgi:hypothetical protein